MEIDNKQEKNAKKMGRMFVINTKEKMKKEREHVVFRGELNF